MKILVVEDERRIARAIKEGLEQEGYAVDLAFDGEEGYACATNDEYDVIITDVMMPVMDGVQLCRTLRSEGHKTPILMLSAKSQERDIVRGLDTGADDYLAKPFSMSVLAARIRSLLRRPHQSVGEILRYSDVELDPAGKTVRRDGQPIMLSQKEFSLLEYFLRNPETILSKNNIISHVWDFDADILPNNVESFIKLLRTKIDRPFNRPLIHTIRGFGYILREESP
jgi:DNA-binding response OmpR family regulator